MTVPHFPRPCGNACYFKDFRVFQERETVVMRSRGHRNWFLWVGKSREFSHSRSTAMSFWLCSQLLQTLNPAPFSCQQQMWQLPYGTWRKVAEFSRSDNTFKTCQILQAKSHLVCLLRRHGEFLTKKREMLYLAWIRAVCTSWSSKLCHTASFTVLQQQSPPIGWKLRD